MKKSRYEKTREVLASFFSSLLGSRSKLWDILAIRWLWYQFAHRKEGAAVQTPLLFWVVGSYSAIYGLASNRFENQAQRLEARANTVIEQMSDEKARPIVCKQIAEVQRRMCPIEPRLFSPISIFSSFLERQSTYEPGVELLQKAVEAWKRELESANLYQADLSGLDLREANLVGAKLDSSNLTGTDLSKARLNQSTLYGATLTRAKLYKANLTNAKLNGSQMLGCDMDKAILTGAELIDANLSGSHLHGARLSGADLTGVDLTMVDMTGVDLRGAKLTRIRNWRKVSSWKNVQVDGVRDSPAGFLELVEAHK